MLGADVTGHPSPPKTTSDYVILYVGLGIALAAVLFFALRAWRDRRERQPFSSKALLRQPGGFEGL
jgi:hypothetical protein